jgi:DNA-binding transcriptional MerR regulator
MAMGSMSEPEGSGTNGLTVGQASARLGVTVRALHHWDEIGLAQPSLRTDSGYRLYMSADLARLQRIIIYRELDLGLDTIRSLLDDPATDPRAALRAQREQVAQRISRLERLADGLDRMIHAHEHGLVLTAQQQAAIFGPDWNPDWITQARNRIMVPDWTDQPMFEAAVEQVAAKDRPVRLDDIRLKSLSEGRCVQTLHIGSYDSEADVLARMHHEFIPGNGLRMIGKHHEIYLSDARKVAPEKLRTILRQPVVSSKASP